MEEDVVDVPSAVRVRKLQPNIGAEISGVDLRQPLGTADRDAIWQALLDHHVIFFRDQFLSRYEHLGFASAFGEPLEDLKHVETHRTIQPIRSGTGGDYHGANWHADGFDLPEPFFAGILLAHELPPLGGDTVFASARAAYEGLSDEVKERIEHLHARHVGHVKAAHLLKDEASQREYLIKMAGAVHPVVNRHPYTGHKQLNLSNVFVTGFEEIEGPEADRLLDHLKQQYYVPEYQVRFTWAPGSIAFWDNRAGQHYAVGDYGDYRRCFERVVIAGPPLA
jgi:alpha-ketoglutarate-dependent taurine dioxygenase